MDPAAVASQIPAFSWEMGVVIGLALLAVVLFITEKLPVEGTSIAILAGLAVAASIGAISQGTVLAGFGNTAPWMVAFLFVVGGATLHTGITHAMARKLEVNSGGSAKRLLVLLLLFVIPMSSVLNNTTVVAVFLPVCMTLSRRFGISPSRLLLPLSFASILGGTCTLIGTSTNVVVARIPPAYDFAGYEPLGMFTMTPAGLIFAAVGAVYLFFTSSRLIPDRAPKVLDQTGAVRRLYVTDLQVGEGSPFIGQSIGEIHLDLPDDEARILHIVRGDDVLQPKVDRATIQEGDLLLVEIIHEQIDRVREKFGLSLHVDHHLRPRREGAEPVVLAEVLIHPDSNLIGRSLAELQFRLSHHVIVLAMTRRARTLDHGFAGLPLAAGDILLVTGSQKAIQRLENSRDVRLLTRGLEEQTVRYQHVPQTLGVLGAFILGCAVTDINIAVLAMMAAGALVGLGCLSMRQAYDSIDWRIVMVLGSSISLGISLEETRASEWIAGQLIALASYFHASDIMLILVIYLITAVLTEMITNNAAAALLVPIAYGVARDLGYSDPTVFLMAVLFGASSAFATPVGYQTNTYVWGPGGYRFRDFVILGLPLKIIMAILATFVLPWLYMDWDPLAAFFGGP